MRWRTRSPPSCHQACVSPVSSRSFFGSLKKIWQETAKTCGSAKPASSGARKSSATRMSLFSSTTMSFDAARNPAFDPPPNPRFFSSGTSFTCGNAVRTNSALPSLEPLSTTTISLAGLAASAPTTEGRYLARRSLPFQLGITTEAALDRGTSAFEPGALRPKSFHKRSATAKTTKLTAISRGEIRSSGRARSKRFKKAMSACRHRRA